MFEKTKIRWALAAAAVDAGLDNMSQDYINRVVGFDVDEAAAGLKFGVLKDAQSAAAYACATHLSHRVYQSPVVAKLNLSASPNEAENYDMVIKVGVSALVNSGAAVANSPAIFNDLLQSRMQERREEVEREWADESNEYGE